MKILVADDSKMARRMVIKILQDCREEKDEIIEAQNGQEAVDLYKEHKPQIVFLDLTMPVMDGFTALKLIKTFDKSAQVVVISADVQQGSMTQVREDGALDFVKKPITDVKMKQIFTKIKAV
ncbi:MAG: response regulator [Candidatus Marinarcus sp.]|uniref:response regulator n=1 Tax=Candidatus Marinarcus sp. TaxID=3100987 RepID=UPI003B000E61